MILSSRCKGNNNGGSCDLSRRLPWLHGLSGSGRDRAVGSNCQLVRMWAIIAAVICWSPGADAGDFPTDVEHLALRSCGFEGAVLFDIPRYTDSFDDNILSLKLHIPLQKLYLANGPVCSTHSRIWKQSIVLCCCQYFSAFLSKLSW